MVTTLDVMKSQVGVAEATGHNDGVPAERYNHGEQLPWCAAQILWCNAASDDPKFASNKAELYDFRSVQAFEEGMKARGWWQASTVPWDHALQPGDVIFFADRGTSDAAGGGKAQRHVGVIERMEISPADKTGGRIVIHTIEGNVGNACWRMSYEWFRPDVQARVTGFARAGGFARPA